MKTKSIFYSLAVAATLTACSQDDLRVAGNETIDLSARPEVNLVSLADDEGAVTRLTSKETSGAPVWEVGEKIGACIMDVPTYETADKYNGDDPSANYKIVEYYSSNSAFTRRDDTNWYLASDMPLVEGNYLFYAPYNDKMNLRTPFEIMVPAKQDATSEKSATEEFYKSGAVVKVGYKFLASEGGVAQKPTVYMEDVFAYPKITIVNNFKGYLKSTDGAVSKFNGGTIRLDSLELIKTNGDGEIQNDVIVGGTLINKNVADVLSGAWNESPFEAYTSQLVTATGDSGDQKGGLKNTIEESRRQKDGVITTFKTMKEIEADEQYVFYGVVPAMQVDGTTTKLKAVLYVTINETPYELTTGTLSFDARQNPTVTDKSMKGHEFKSGINTIKLIKGQIYPQEELNFDGQLTAKEQQKGKIMTITLGDNTSAGSVEYGKEIEVKTDGPDEPDTRVLIHDNTEWITWMSNQLNGSALTEKTEEGASTEDGSYVFAENHTCTIDADLITALSNYNHKGTMAINSGLVIASDLEWTIVDAEEKKVTFGTGDVDYTITLGDGYTIADGILTSVSGDETMTILVGTVNEWEVTTPVVAKNIVIKSGSSVNIGDKASMTAETIEIAKGAYVFLSGGIYGAITNNGYLGAETTGAVATVVGGKGLIGIGFEDIAITKVQVTGGTQTVRCNMPETDEGRTINTEKLKTINSTSKLTITELYSYYGTVTADADFMSSLGQINMLYVQTVTFDSGEFNTTGLGFVMTQNSNKISGKGVNTVVKGLKLYRASGDMNVYLQDIIAYGKTGSGTTVVCKENATWTPEE